MGFRSSTNPEVPVISFSIENLRPKSTKWVETCSHVRAALEEYGCFLAEYENDVEQEVELDDAIFNGLEKLFDLPLETKMKNVSDKPYHGFLDHRAPFVLPLHESFGIENAASFEGVESFVKLMWPSGNHHFCEDLFAYTKMVSEMEKLVKRMVFESYGVEKYYDSHIASTTYLLRGMKYRIPEMGEQNIGAEAHTDKSFFTILHQNGVNGLEIKAKKDDHWIGLQFNPNSFLVMAGDACLAWSNGRIHSATHRVIIEGSKERYSTALFSYHKGVIEIPNELVDEQFPLKFNPFNHYGLLGYFSKEDCEKTPSTAGAYCGV
ncbi:2-oxoglutarate-dependent dioxygenase AOP3-like [Cucurbita pepo subsp. pepo]|uniref:2-oxoglutarate-dependent dioxygenase AOP3-like n=1 Tax=Cucurbita pepo subsp. pepo TaxID=3664 RepID=UPI000C9D3FBC|nr:2-oxoglutarate-dependent dioxygenase AOP3-like [Cucurbita pepo subsp. pepo]